MQCSVGASDPPGTITGVISSKERAPRFGPGRLVVDGTDDRLCRKATFAFRPSRRQERQLLALLRACCEVYNAREHHKLAQKSDNWARETARMLVAQADVIALENLHLLSMTKSASGTLDSPGTNVAAKAGLNRAMRDASLGRLARWVCVKAEEAGRRAWLVDAVDTSRRCAVCGNIDSRSRPAREVFSCIACGHGDHSDTNAAVNVAVRGQACEAAWRAAGSPRLKRPTPRLRRRSGPA